MPTVESRLRLLEAEAQEPAQPLSALVLMQGSNPAAERAAYVAAHGRAPEFTIEVLFVQPQHTVD